MEAPVDHRRPGLVSRGIAKTSEKRDFPKRQRTVPERIDCYPLGISARTPAKKSSLPPEARFYTKARCSGCLGGTDDGGIRPTLTDGARVYDVLRFGRETGEIFVDLPLGR